MSKWKEIRTAPRDGTSILSVVWYEQDGQTYHEFVVIQWDMLEGDGWCDQSGFLFEDYTPTHWTPIPSLPDFSKAEGTQP